MYGCPVVFLLSATKAQPELSDWDAVSCKSPRDRETEQAALTQKNQITGKMTSMDPKNLEVDQHDGIQNVEQSGAKTKRGKKKRPMPLARSSEFVKRYNIFGKEDDRK